MLKEAKQLKKLLAAVTLFPFMALAQNNAAMSPEMMEMMEQAQKAQLCMQEIDIAALEEMSEEGKKMESRIKALCASGKRDQAQEEAVAFSRKMMNLPSMQELRKCSEHLRGILPRMPFDNIEEEFENRNICDEM